MKTHLNIFPTTEHFQYYESVKYIRNACNLIKLTKSETLLTKEVNKYNKLANQSSKTFVRKENCSPESPARSGDYGKKKEFNVFAK